jgi:dTDP-4-dehydrorhamnose reductase
MKVLILGATGMLGGAVFREFEGFAGEVFASSRAPIPLESMITSQILFDVRTDAVSEALSNLGEGDYVINCIGVIKSEIDESSPTSRDNATLINATFPQNLAQEAEKRGIRVIQIATDCAFSGRVGQYTESSEHDALDHYGKSKVAGEISSRSMMHLRVSIIGPETRGHKSLYDWVAQQPSGARIKGFNNHIWNGISAKAFGRIARGIIEKGNFIAGVHHVVPQNEVTKCELVKLIASRTGRSDLTIIEGFAPESINRTLATNDKDFNAKLWAGAGRETLPTVAELVAEI